MWDRQGVHRPGRAPSRCLSGDLGTGQDNAIAQEEKALGAGFYVAFRR